MAEPAFDVSSYKSIKLDKEQQASAGSNTAANGRRATSQVQRREGAVTIEDVPDGEDGDEGDDGFAPGGDADYFAEEDEDGRF